MEEVYDGANPGIESSQSENFGFAWCGTRVGVKTDEGLVDGLASIMTRDYHFLVGAVRQLLFRMENRAQG